MVFTRINMKRNIPGRWRIPFDSDRKRMTTVNRLSDRNTRVNVKGGLDEVLSVCNRIIIAGEIKPISEQDTG
jgi:Ca2+-transporting ATPase